MNTNDKSLIQVFHGPNRRVSNQDLMTIEKRLPGVYRNDVNRRRFSGRGMHLELLFDRWEAHFPSRSLAMASTKSELNFLIDAIETEGLLEDRHG